MVPRCRLALGDTQQGLHQVHAHYRTRPQGKSPPIRNQRRQRRTGFAAQEDSKDNPAVPAGERKDANHGVISYI